MPNQRNRRKLTETCNLPAIPDKLYFTIGEVGRLCDLKPHVLRYWEQEFSQLHPNKRRGNRRYYQRKDVELIRSIRQLLYEEGFTIKGARQRLAELETSTKKQSKQKVTAPVQSVVADLEQLLGELEQAEQ